MGRHGSIKRTFATFLLPAFGFLYLIYFVSTRNDLLTTNKHVRVVHTFSNDEDFSTISDNAVLRDDVIEKEIKDLVERYDSGKTPTLISPFVRLVDDDDDDQPVTVETSVKSPTTQLNLDSPYKKHTLPAKNDDVDDVVHAKSTPGVLNVHYWNGFCGSRVEDLKRNIHFPYYPSESGTISRFFVQRYETGYGQRIFGYLHPTETGNFTFAISCDDNCEMWLSDSEDVAGIRRLAYVGTMKRPLNTKIADFQAFPSQISQPLFLDVNKKYYVEVLHKQGAYQDHVLVTWLAPSWQRIRSIQSKDVSSFIEVSKSKVDVNEYKRFIPKTKACHVGDISSRNDSVYFFDRQKYNFTSKDDREDFFLTPSVDMSDFVGVLPSIDYAPSYVLDFTPRRYEGVYLVHEGGIYPDDFTKLTHMESYEHCYRPRKTDSHFNTLRRRYGGDNGYDGDDIMFGDNFLRAKPTSTQDILNRNKNLRSTLKTENTGSIAGNTKKNDKEKLTLNSRERLEAKKESFRREKPQHSRKLLSIDTNLTKTKYTFKNITKNENKNKMGNDFSVLNASKLQGYDHHYPNRPSRNKMKLNIRPYLKRPRNYIRSGSMELRGRREERSYRHQPRSKFKRKIKIYKSHVNFINGELVNASRNHTMKDRHYILHFYPLFGPAIYHLLHKFARLFVWKYHVYLSKCKTDGNLPLAKQVALDVVHRYMKAVKAKHGQNYSLRKIVNVEENHDVMKGDRYFLELELNVKGQDKPRRISKFIYRDLVTNDLYEPKNFQWNPKATVHVIVPVKDQGRWVQHFIDNMERVYLETMDEMLNVIIVDFNSSDIDIKRGLHKSRLKRYNLIQLDGPFQRAYGIQAGADLVKNKEDIIFTCDLHLDIPALLIDSIRKHTIMEKMGFAPIVYRLSCGYTPELPYGLWEIDGYGLFSISKFDFDRIGGMNTKEFKTKWGGEDWEFLDRALGHGLEVERLRIPNFFHHYHSKKKMWVASTTPAPTLNLTSETSTTESP